ncbi:preprotein translocase subunit SecG [Nitratidesulfovibrio sp. SRB-5]|uniref:preprotein translocase subunit SecG n=1 Tax=Nitratidesulfovibrio sp. SRB-5 TaxID=2872636 RepID=UPI0010267286|nr:preprotein translocase subunit SecG [Nitratidesulfovibrio sp. SRB-5]MBZ2171738.1 preprotein translocase subunit SecG [Nitratidesulfovibrio sp. SRB-5]RXF78682.1 preprotein translocase subunit SecG [Desulfovibrio sp. DS-1]
MQTLILTLHVVACLALIVLVLLQSGKEGMGVIFGGGNTSLFGSTGAGGMLAKLTAFLAVLFIITSLSYNVLTSSRKSDDSTILDVKLEDVQPAPGAPAAPAAPAPAAPAEQKSN